MLVVLVNPPPPPFVKELLVVKLLKYVLDIDKNKYSGRCYLLVVMEFTRFGIRLRSVSGTSSQNRRRSGIGSLPIFFELPPCSSGMVLTSVNTVGPKSIICHFFFVDVEKSS